MLGKLIFILTSIIFIFYSNSTLASECDIDLAIDYYLAEDYEGAVRESQPCADEGYPGAQYILGEYYFFEMEDYPNAFKWFNQAAKQDDPDSLYFVGLMYEKGLFVKENHNTAIEYYKMSADEGDADAKYRIGYLYSTAGWGSSLKRDYKISEKWYKEAADEGHAAAAYNLHVSYFNGWLNGDADKWLQIAADLGHEEAISELEAAQSENDIMNKLQNFIDNNSAGDL